MHGSSVVLATNAVSFVCTEGPEANAVYKVRDLISRNPNAGVHVHITVLAYFGQDQ